MRHYPVVLVNVSRTTNTIMFPMGLSVIANTCLHHGIEPLIIDLTPVPPEDQVDTFIRLMPDEPAIYGFSLMLGNRHLDATAVYSNIIRARSPDSVIVYGGSLPSALPELIVERAPCDLVVHGEGEVTFPALVKALRAGDRHPEMDGVFSVRDGRAQGKRAKRMRRLDHLSRKDFSRFDVGFYAGFCREVDEGWEVMASRGCRASCSFCYKFMGDGIGAVDPGVVMDEIQYIIENHGLRRFYFVDENFMQVKKYFFSFLKEKERRGLDFQFVAQSRIDEIDAERLEAGRHNGLICVSTGVESASQTVLDAIDKGISVAQTERAIALLRKHGVRPAINLIIGFEEETESDYRAMIDFVDRNQLSDCIKLSYLTPLPATRIYDRARERGLIVDEYEYIRGLNNLYWELVVNMTSMPDATVRHYYDAITGGRKRPRRLPASEKYLRIMNPLFMYDTGET
ncbi:MAG: B12-binding domain-containing radical SAM protein [Alphaproteobacteria bacterium]